VGPGGRTRLQKQTQRLLHRARPQLWASDTAQLSDRPGALRASWHQPPQVSHHLVTSRAFSFRPLEVEIQKNILESINRGSRSGLAVAQCEILLSTID